MVRCPSKRAVCLLKDFCPLRAWSLALALAWHKMCSRSDARGQTNQSQGHLLCESNNIARVGSTVRLRETTETKAACWSNRGGFQSKLPPRCSARSVRTQQYGIGTLGSNLLLLSLTELLMRGCPSAACPPENESSIDSVFIWCVRTFR